MSEYVITEFVTVTPGQPFRLLPFGRLVKNGRTREITADVAARFRLPHFRPPIKLGSHEDATPAGGHIIGLEVRDDGLYAVPEFNDRGAAAMAEGAYRYHSPEIVWDGGLEDPATGAMLEGPLIVGDALLHTPHLGEAAALYAAEITEGDGNMTTETVTVPVSWLDRIFGRVPEPEAPEPPQQMTAITPDVDQLAAIQAERDDLAMRLVALETEQQRRARVEHFETELAETALAEDTELPALLAGLTDETVAAELLRRFKALAEQARVAALTADVGHEGQATTGDPRMDLDAAVKAEMSKSAADYLTALKTITSTQPELVKAAGYGR